jgi:hypothetical protein
MLPAFPPRFSHGYGDLRRLATVLVENHSLKPVRQRVLGTYTLLRSTLRVAAMEIAALREATRADRERINSEPVLTWRPAEEPTRRIQFHPIASEYYLSPASGAWEVRWLGRPLPPIETPLYGSRPASSIARPLGYWVPVAESEVIDKLRQHGVAITVTPTPVEVDVAMIRLSGVTLAAHVSERRVAVSADGSTVELRRERFHTGSAYVPTDQPLGDLVIQMLEPSCADSLFAHGFISGTLDEVEYMEAYVVAPMADQMLAADPLLRDEFEAALAADAGFAADPTERLRWFYRRSPYRDERHLLYPIGRVIN